MRHGAHFACLVAALSLFGPNVEALSSGVETTNCGGCHEAGQAELSVAIDPQQPEPGETLDILVTIGANGMAAAGMAFFATDGGSFSVEEADSLSVSGTSVIHTQPKPATDNQVQFHLKWQTPSAIGVARFDVAVLAANGNRQNSGDWSAETSLSFGIGCTPETLYWDADRDGFGRDDTTFESCDIYDDYRPQAGDCDDQSEGVFPGAPELCNELDDDCDGEIDEESMTVPFYADADGDGFGDPVVMLAACVPPEGYVQNNEDCHDGTTLVNPNAPENCDYLDNDCDGEIDEDVRPICGLGSCARVSEACVEGLSCSPGEPSEEVCNGLDDDCDGETDEQGCAPNERCLNAECVPSSELANGSDSDATGSGTNIDDTSSAAQDSTSGAALGTTSAAEPAATTGVDAPASPHGSENEVSAAPTGCATRPFKHRSNTSAALFAAALLLAAFVRRRRSV